jgi:hypothetical protein
MALMGRGTQIKEADTYLLWRCFVSTMIYGSRGGVRKRIIVSLSTDRSLVVPAGEKRC